ncbi:hypothetical protein KRR38_30500 [Novosphingobium sp. G106]|uniref:hypothetical protein n=1 Tax=Novosphingobium sp. G106 TaxID=2849500 RepID=UPI001C2DBF2A|nr:hypothetical protein [Novosphingobium sp. G106]MBV1691880.1 hypothetical protein [Novosphingobium sp. G106]
MGRAYALTTNLLGQATRWLTRAEQEDLIERPIVPSDALGFSSRQNKYAVGKGEDF